MSRSQNVVRLTFACLVAVQCMLAQASEPRVAIVVDATLLQMIEPVVARLREDLKADGYDGFVQPWTAGSGGDGHALWQVLKSEFNSPAKLRGAILIGEVPTPSIKVNIGGKARTVRSDLPYWTMTGWKVRAGVDIWVSRFWARAKDSTRLYVGHEVTLLKRALQANHDYRRGLSRLPHTAYGHINQVAKNYQQDGRSALDVWPKFQVVTSAIEALDLGGEFFHVQSHGNTVGYSSRVSLSNVHDSPAQLRVSAISITHGFSGLGGLGFQQLMTRNGGNVLNFGASGFAGFAPSYSSVAMLGPQQANFRKLLADGMSWGDALLKNYIFRDPGVLFMGDLSLRAMPHPPNKIPTVTRWRPSKTTGNAPLEVKFDAAARDKDGKIALYEWFLEGHGYGKLSPVLTSDQALKGVSHLFPLPRRYMARVEAVDDYKARAFKEVEIAATAGPDTAIRINAGQYPHFQSADWDNHEWYKPGLDVVDTQGRLWMHDQKHGKGTWGWLERGRVEVVPAHRKITNTANPELFRTMTSGARRRNQNIHYRIPLPPGDYVVKLGFAEFHSNARIGMREMDIVVEGEMQERRFDILKEAGAPFHAVVRTYPMNVSDSALDIEVLAHGPGADKQALNPLLNFIEILPKGYSNAPPSAQIAIVKSDNDGQVSFKATANDADEDSLFYRWDFDDGNSAVVAAPTHRFTEPRAHHVRLTVYDGHGNATLVSKLVELYSDGTIVAR